MERRLALILLVVAACGGDGPDGPVPDTSDELFLPDEVLEVVVTMDPTDFDLLRNQTRSIPETLQGDCMAAPFESPFTRFHADVTVDGVDYIDVSIKKKGFFGSGLGPASIDKPGLKLDADQYVPDQKFGGPGGLEHLVLNNSVQDPSYARTCLGYQVLADAGIEAPRCHFARVTVNGEYLGLYVHIEDVDDDFLERRFADPTGTLYKGILSDFRTGWSSTFHLEEGPGAGERVAALTAALEGPDETLLAAVEAEVDVDGFLTIWAAESLVRHWDGYAGNTNNFFAYDDPDGGRLVFLPWGVDQVMQNGGGAPMSVYGTSALANRLYQQPAIAQRYVDRLREVIDAAWDEAELHAEIDRIEALIRPYAGDLTPEIGDVRAFVDARRGIIEAEIAGGPPPLDPNLRGPFCIAPIGHISGTYATTWGTGAGDPWVEGTGTLTATVNGTELSFTQYGAVADFDANDPDQATIILFAAQPNGRIAAALLSFRASRVRDNESLRIDWAPTYAALMEFDPGPQTWTNLGTFGIGAIQVDDGSTTDGAVVDGSFDADLVYPPW